MRATSVEQGSSCDFTEFSEFAANLKILLAPKYVSTIAEMESSSYYSCNICGQVSPLTLCMSFDRQRCRPS